MADKPKVKAKQKTTGFSPTAEDMKLIQELRSKYAPTMGAVTNASILRMGLRALAAKEGIAA